MGLDSVELVMRLEEDFGIKIDDAEATGVHTVGDLHELVMRKATHLEERRCSTAWAFRRLRRALVEEGVERKKVRPRTVIAELVPRRIRRAVWKRLSDPVLKRIPSLKLGKGTYLCAAICVCAGAAGLGYWLTRSVAGTVQMGLPILVSLIGAAFVITRPLATEAPGDGTVGDLSRMAVALNWQKVATALPAVQRRSIEPGKVDEREIWNAVSHIVADELGVSPAELRPETRLVEDLNLD